MRLTFLGTRGEIEARTRQHRMHSSLLAAHGACVVMIDCRADWLKHVMNLRANSIFLTHAHSDHAGGLKNSAPCEVFCNGPRLGRSYRVKLYPVEHSLIAPAVGYRVTGAGHSIFYVPDVASIPEVARALSGIAMYIGDGATISRPLVRRRDSALIGYAPITTQLQ